MDITTIGYLRMGSLGMNVRTLQAKLNTQGAMLSTDGIFGLRTKRAVLNYQRRIGLKADGIVGPKTWTALKNMTYPRYLLPSDLYNAAQGLDVSVAALKAVVDIESSGSGFFNNGCPKILFERHVMRRELLKEANGDAQQIAIIGELEVLHPDIINIKPGGYLGGIDEYSKLRRARLISDSAALSAASWGLFQIMGFHWKRLGYTSVQAFADAMNAGEHEQLEAFVTFIVTDKRLHNALKSRDWNDFARIYNGRNYHVNAYSKRLASAYKKHARSTPDSPVTTSNTGEIA